MSRTLGALLVALAACGGPAQTVPTEVFRAERENSGTERYSAWFADTDGRILYFGLSPFWELWWARGGDARADLDETGDHLIGRFDMGAERFLEPLRVRARGPDVRSSVWDVLVHSNGRIYYTTYFEELGSVRPDGSDVSAISRGSGSGSMSWSKVRTSEHLRDALLGCARRPLAAELRIRRGRSHPTGALLREHPLRRARGTARSWRRRASRSTRPPERDLAEYRHVHAGWICRARVDPAVGRRRGAASAAAARPSSCSWPSTARGRGWFAEDASGELRLRIRDGGEPGPTPCSLGPPGRARLRAGHPIHEGRGPCWRSGPAG